MPLPPFRVARAGDAVPLVSTMFERDARFPVAARIPVNQRIFRVDTGLHQRWTGAMWVDDVGLGALAPLVPAGRALGLDAPQYVANNATFNVRDFGAVGDAVADDAPAIQRAIDAAEPVRGRAFLPNGHYRLGSSLRWPSFVTIEGESENGAVLDNQHAVLNAPQVVNKNPNVMYYGRMKNLSLRGGTWGVDFNLTGEQANCTWENVAFELQTRGGVRSNKHLQVNLWSRCTFYNCTSGVTLTVGTANANTFRDTEFLGLVGPHVSFCTAEVNNFSGTRHEGGGTAGQVAINLSNARNTNFEGAYFENCHQTLLNATGGSSGTRFDGCHFTYGAAGATPVPFVFTADHAVAFGSNSWHMATAGPAQACVTAPQNDAARFGGAGLSYVVHQARGFHHLVSGTHPSPGNTTRDLVTLARDASNAAPTSHQLVTGRLTVHLSCFDARGLQTLFSRTYHVTVTAIGATPMAAVVVQGTAADTPRSATMTVQVKAGASSGSLTLQAAFTGLPTAPTASVFGWEWSDLSSSNTGAGQPGPIAAALVA